MRSVIAFIDPLTSAHLARRLPKSEFVSVGVCYKASSTEHKVSLYLGFDYQAFDHLIQFDDDADFDHLAEQLTALGTDYIFCGFEDGAPLCDRLSERLGLATANDPRTTEWRCNKYQMIQRLCDLGIAAPRHLLVDSCQTEIPDVSQFDFPFIIKPAFGETGAMHDVAEIHTHQQLIDFVRPLQRNQSETRLFVIEEKLQDNEIADDNEEVTYNIDAFSFQGNHCIYAIHRWIKKRYDQKLMYTHSELINQSHPNYGCAYQYIQKVLTALDFKNGFSHSEIFITDQGPKLVEINPRVAGLGGLITEMAEQSLGMPITQIMLNHLNGVPPLLDRTQMRKQAAIAFIYHVDRSNPEQNHLFNEIRKHPAYIHEKYSECFGGGEIIFLLAHQDRNTLNDAITKISDIKYKIEVGFQKV
ncbi:MAG: hypothetical protein S4CHLAM2_02390 [Chlamydiales bacterium]|nr:hypothetical protein [Chlamydiales bacterium]